MSTLFVYHVPHPEGFVVGIGRDLEYAHWDHMNRSRIHGSPRLTFGLVRCVAGRTFEVGAIPVGKIGGRLIS
jgi:hypothetical protein